LYVNFQENPAQLARSIQNLSGREAEETIESGLKLLYISPVEVQIDSVVVRLFRMIQEQDIGRVVIDSIGDLSMAASDPQRLHGYLYALVQHFAVKGITAMFILQTGDMSGFNMDFPMGRISYISDNIISLAVNDDKDPCLELTCTKSRGTERDMTSRKFHIAKDGLHIT
jgi:circadian clock protein KaiC